MDPEVFPHTQQLFQSINHIWNENKKKFWWKFYENIFIFPRKTTTNNDDDDLSLWNIDGKKIFRNKIIGYQYNNDDDDDDFNFLPNMIHFNTHVNLDFVFPPSNLY